MAPERARIVDDSTSQADAIVALQVIVGRLARRLARVERRCADLEAAQLLAADVALLQALIAHAMTDPVTGARINFTTRELWRHRAEDPELAAALADMPSAAMLGRTLGRLARRQLVANGTRLDFVIRGNSGRIWILTDAAPS
jgi:hypothetical protein